MKITYKEIQKRLKLIWPELKHIWCFDEEYDFPKIEEVRDFLDLNAIPKIEAESPDCDDYALQLHALVKRYVNWSFGECFADKVDGWSKFHNLNVCVCHDGIYLIDRGRSHEADSNNDNILFVRM